MKTQPRVGKLFGLSAGTLMLVLLLVPATRPRYTGSSIESFDSTATMDSRTSVDGWGTGSLKLKTAYGNFSALALTSYPSWADAVTANDFDGDGWQDVIVSGSKYANVLAFAKNQSATQPKTFEITQWIGGCGGTGTPSYGFDGLSLDSSSYVGLTSGDYDGDGDFDVFFITSTRESPSTVERVYLCQNLLIDSGTMSFSCFDLTTAWVGAKALPGLGETARCLVSVDWDLDDDIDILYGDGTGTIHELKNIADEVFGADKFDFDVASPLLETTFTASGIQGFAVADIDLDQDPDFILGSRASSDLVLYENVGMDTFLPETSYTFSHATYGPGSVGFALAGDFDNDGDVGLIVGAVYPAGAAGTSPTYVEVYQFTNDTGVLGEKLLFSGMIADSAATNGCNFGALIDADHDGHPDVIAGGMNFATGASGRFLVQNASNGLYNLFGEAVTMPVNPDLLQTKLIVKVELSEFYMGYIGSKNTGLMLQFYASNDGGANWTYVCEWKDSNLKYKSDKKRIDFKSWGSELMIKVLFLAAEDKDSRTRLLLGGSQETPKLDSVKITYTYENQGEFSRASVATGLYNDASNVTHRLVVSGSFYYPGYEGRLIAYDSSVMDFNPVDDYSLKTISETDFEASSTSYRNIIPAGTYIAWDAGQLLKNRSASSRTIYTAIPEREEDDDDWKLNRLDFTTAQAPTLKRFLREHNNRTAALIDFIRGTNRAWKLGFIDHSTLFILGPPEGAPASMGDGYLAFKNDQIARQKVVFAGANDGMIHCFDFKTGEELWGFIPYNLLDNLKKMTKWDKKNRLFYYNAKKAEYFVDGNPVCADVYIDKNGDGVKEWTTILVCGQRKGMGKSKKSLKNNFYFALDVTDVANPQPLWEFSTKDIGETWSVPAIGKVLRATGDKWLAFLASGYGSKEDEVFAVDLDNGLQYWKCDVGKLDTKTLIKYKKSVASSPRLVDINLDGYVDRMYVGDLFGRLWKVDLTQTTWTPTAIYTDKTGLPILTRPAVWINRTAGDTTPHLYFGTGGDDLAPANDLYSFIALIDGATPTIEWIVGNKNDFGGLATSKVKGTLETGERVWADPVVSDDIVYFTTFFGNIEQISFDVAAGEIGKLYGRYVNHATPSMIGTSIFGTTNFLTLSSKARQAVVTGELRTNAQGKNERDIFIQELDSTIQALTRGGGTNHVDNPTATTFRLKIKSWREIYQIIR